VRPGLAAGTDMCGDYKGRRVGEAEGGLSRAGFDARQS